MSSILAKIWAKLNTKRSSFSFMIVGLDNSGKTSVLNYMISSSNVRQNRGRKCRQQQCERIKEQRQNQQAPSALEDSNNSKEPKMHQFAIDDLEASFSLSLESQPHNLSGNSSPIGEAARFSNSTGANVTPTIGYNYEQIQLKGLTVTVLDFSGQSKYRCLWQEFYNSVDAVVFVIDSSDLLRFVVVRDELECMLSHPYFSAMAGKVTVHQQVQSETSSETSEPPRRSVSLMKSLGSSAVSLAQKQLSISQGRLIQSPLDMAPLTQAASSQSRCRSNTLAVRDNIEQQRSSGQAAQRKRTKVPILFLANKADLPNSVDTEVISKALNLNQLPSDRHPWLIQATSTTTGLGINEGFDWLASHLVATQR